MPDLTTAQTSWLAAHAAQVATVMNLDEPSVSHALVSGMREQPRSLDEARAYANRTAARLAQLAGWDDNEAIELLDDFGYVRLVGDDAA